MRRRAVFAAGLLVVAMGVFAGCGSDPSRGTVPGTTSDTASVETTVPTTATTSTASTVFDTTTSTVAGDTTTTVASPGETTTTVASGGVVTPPTTVAAATTTVPFKPYVTQWGGQCNTRKDLPGFTITAFANWSDGFVENLNSPGPYFTSANNVVVGPRGSSVSITIASGTCTLTVTRGGV